MGKRKLESTVDGDSEENDRSLKTPDGGASDEEFVVEVKVVGEIKKAGGKLKGDKGRKLYQAFEVEGSRYEVVRAFSLTTGPYSASREVYELVLLQFCRAKLPMHWCYAVLMDLISRCESHSVMNMI